MAGERSLRVGPPSLPPLEVQLGRLAGRHEAALAPGRAGEPTRLLAALVRGADGQPLDLETLPATLHDRLLAEVYRAELGERAACRARCVPCGQPFEFELGIGDLIAAQDADAAACGRPDADGCWAVGGCRVRVPTLGDAASGAEALSTLLCDPPPADADAAAAVLGFLERAAPLLSLDLDAACPHCGAAQQLAFDLPAFLVQSIAAERPFLVRETHLIAARYGWSHAEIMGLPRDDRRAHAALIEGERSATLRARSVA